MLLRGSLPPGGSSGVPWGLKIDTTGSPNSFKRVSKFILEFSWASFARFLLSVMALGPFLFPSEPLGVDFELPN